jgi:hypothetical protein
VGLGSEPPALVASAGRTHSCGARHACFFGCGQARCLACVRCRSSWRWPPGVSPTASGARTPTLGAARPAVETRGARRRRTEGVRLIHQMFKMTLPSERRAPNRREALPSTHDPLIQESPAAGSFSLQIERSGIYTRPQFKCQAGSKIRAIATFFLSGSLFRHCHQSLDREHERLVSNEQHGRSIAIYSHSRPLATGSARRPSKT